MKHLVPIPVEFLQQLKDAEETGIGYQVVQIRLKDGRSFDQVATSNNYIIEVRGYRNSPFASEDIVSVVVNHKSWNFRAWSDATRKAKVKSVLS